MGNLKIEDIVFSSSSLEFEPTNSKVKTASSNRIRVASLNQIASSGFKFVSNDTLIRTSKKDFWKLGEDADGAFIERLVSDDEGPVEG